MKTKNNLLLSLLTVTAASLLLLSCGGNKKAPSEPDLPGSDFLKQEMPAYDPDVTDPNAPVEELTLKALGNTMADMNFDQTELKVKAGSTVRLTLINTSKDSSMQHNVVIIDKDAMQQVADAGLKAGVDRQFIPDMDEVLVATKLAMPGETVSVIFPAPPAGEYKFVCTYPGHYSKMNGKFFVE